jgi:hypothetical protein
LGGFVFAILLGASESRFEYQFRYKVNATPPQRGFEAVGGEE